MNCKYTNPRPAGYRGLRLYKGRRKSGQGGVLLFLTFIAHGPSRRLRPKHKSPRHFRGRGLLVIRKGTSPLPLPVLANHDPGLDRQLHRGEAQSLFRDDFADAINLEHDPARLDTASPEIHRTLTLTHPNFGGLRGDGRIGEDTDPDTALTLHVTRHGTACSLDLARGDALGLGRFQTIGAEVEIRPAFGDAMDPALMLLAEFSALWLKHLSFLLSDGRRRHEARDHPGVPGLCGHEHLDRAP